MKTPELYDNKGWFNPYLVYAIIWTAVFAMVVISYQALNVRNEALKTRNSLEQVKKETRESSELFHKLEIIKSNENSIEENDKENETLKTEIREVAKELPKYGIESKSKYLLIE